MLKMPKTGVLQTFLSSAYILSVSHWLCLSLTLSLTVSVSCFLCSVCVQGLYKGFPVHRLSFSRCLCLSLSLCPCFLCSVCVQGLYKGFPVLWVGRSDPALLHLGPSMWVGIIFPRQIGKLANVRTSLQNSSRLIGKFANICWKIW